MKVAVAPLQDHQATGQPRLYQYLEEYDIVGLTIPRNEMRMRKAQPAVVY